MRMAANAKNISFFKKRDSTGVSSDVVTNSRLDYLWIRV
jgi:hypothetical protein